MAEELTGGLKSSSNRWLVQRLNQAAHLPVPGVEIQCDTGSMIMSSSLGPRVRRG